MRILVACEESGIVTEEFRKQGHEAYSCDLLPTSGNHPEWHIQGDVLPLLKQEWDMIIAFPPCTYLTVTGNRWFNIDRYGEKAIQRHKDREEAIKFFMEFVNADCPRIAIENPVGTMSKAYRKPDAVYSRINEMYPNLKKISIFAREPREDFDTWGNEVDKFAP